MLADVPRQSTQLVPSLARNLSVSSTATMFVGPSALRSPFWESRIQAVLLCAISMQSLVSHLSSCDERQRQLLNLRAFPTTFQSDSTL